MRARFLILSLIAACDWSRPPRPIPDVPIEECAPIVGTGSVAIDLSCEPDRCAAFASESACRLELTISECMNVQLSARTDPQLLFEPSAELGTCVAAEPRTDALAAFICETTTGMCRGDLYPVSQTIEVEDLSIVKIFDVPFQAYNGTDHDPLDRGSVLYGYLSDAEMVGGRIAVGGLDGRYKRPRCTTDRSTISFVDLDSLAVETTTAPPCLFRLALDSAHDELIGLFGGGAPSLARFDLRGRLLASKPVVIPLETGFQYPVGLAIDASGRARVTITSDDNPRFTYVISVDLPSLDVAVTSDRIGAFVRSSALDGDEIFASDHEGEQLRRVGADGHLLSALVLFGEVLLANDPGFVFRPPGSERLFVSTTGRRGGTWVLEPGAQQMLVGAALDFHERGVPWAMSTWPKDQRVIAVGVTEGVGEFAARLALFDVEEVHYRAPTLRIGQGLVGKMLVDPRGRVWALLNWSAELVRITPR